MKLTWKIYSFFFLSLCLNDLLLIINKNSILNVYYNTTMIFSAWYALPYFLNIFNVLLTVLIALFIFGYAFNQPDFSKLPAWIFYVRTLSDLTGHSYELKFVLSSFVQGKWFGLLTAFAIILPILPSYLIQWQITFGQNKNP